MYKQEKCNVFDLEIVFSIREFIVRKVNVNLNGTTFNYLIFSSPCWNFRMIFLDLLLFAATFVLKLSTIMNFFSNFHRASVYRVTRKTRHSHTQRGTIQSFVIVFKERSSQTSRQMFKVRCIYVCVSENIMLKHNWGWTYARFFW